MTASKIGLALLVLAPLVGAFMLVFVLVRASLRRAVPQTRQVAEQALRAMLSPLDDKANLRIESDLAGLHVRGDVEGCAISLQYRTVGLVGVGRHPYGGFRLLILRVAVTPPQVENVRSALETIAERFGGRGSVFGVVRVAGGWVEWHNPKREPGAEVIEILGELAHATKG